MSKPNRDAAELNAGGGVNVQFFCLALKWLGEHYPDRACAEPMECVRQALAEAEHHYRRLPVMPSRRKGGRPT